MSFCTVINCMDGRVQLPVIGYMKKRFAVDYVDVVTEPGPVRILSEKSESSAVESILVRVNMSVEKHKSTVIAIVAHYDCAGNPSAEDKQRGQLEDSCRYIAGLYPSVEIIGLWLGADWKVKEIVH